MLNAKVAGLLNNQFNAELYSAYLYLSFTDYFEHDGLDGFAVWYKAQSIEEIDHAMFIRRYLTEQGEQVRFDMIAEVPEDELDIDDILTEALTHEREVTEMIHRLSREASAANDLRTAAFLNWFIREQAEEEKNAEDMLRKYYLFGCCHHCDSCRNDTDTEYALCGSGLYSLNRELAGRRYTELRYPLE